jgi:hypothetical protein
VVIQGDEGAKVRTAKGGCGESAVACLRKGYNWTGNLSCPAELS